MTSETTPTTLRDREPGTEAGKALTRLGQAHVIAFATAARITTDTANRIVRAIEERAATEARRELLAKVEGLWLEWKGDNVHLTSEQFDAAMGFRNALARALADPDLPRDARDEPRLRRLGAWSEFGDGR